MSESDTPRTDEAAFVSGPPSDRHDVVTVQFAERLERELRAAKSALSGRTVSCCNCNTMADENATLREAIKEAGSVMKALNPYVGYPSTPPDVVSQFRDTLSKLQPHLK